MKIETLSQPARRVLGEELSKLVQRLQSREDDFRIEAAEAVLGREDSKAEATLILLTELSGVRQSIESEVAKAQFAETATGVAKTVALDATPTWKRYGLGVTLNWQPIQSWDDASTFADAIQAIGCERVASLQLSVNYLPLVGRDVRRLPHQRYRMQMEKRGEWLVVTHSSTKRKCELLHLIRSRLGLNLTAAIVRPQAPIQMLTNPEGLL